MTPLQLLRRFTGNSGVCVVYKQTGYWHNWFQWWVSGDTGTNGFIIALCLESAYGSVQSRIVHHPGQRRPAG